jgi:hypothetical protein
MPKSSASQASLSAAGHFVTTRWTQVVAAGQSHDSTHARAALEQLCRTYWYPLYAFIRRQGHAPHDAQDLTQEFFARLLERNALGAESRYALEPVDTLTADRIFERRWGLLLLGRLAFRRPVWTKFRLACAAVALALNAFALYLALGRHHLIDWLEGH